MNDLLVLAAELAVAMAGFTAVFSVLDPREQPSNRILQRFRVRQIVENSMATLLACLLPLFLGVADLPESVVWRISGAVMALTLIGLFIRQNRQIPAHHLASAPRYSRSYANFLRALGITITIAFGAAAASASDRASTFYALGVVVMLAFVGLVFVRAATVLMDLRGKEHSQ